MIDGEGNSCVVWNCCLKEGCNTEFGDEIHWVRVDAQGVPAAVLTIPSSPGNLDYSLGPPEVAVDAQGTSCMVWSGHRGKDLELYWVRISAGGALGDVSRLSVYGGSNGFYDESPRIAADARGNVYVTWYTYRMHIDRGIPYDVYWVRIDESGKPGEVQKISAGDVLCDFPHENVHEISS